MENLDDTIKQLEEKTAVLLKTQEEKEVQGRDTLILFAVLRFWVSKQKILVFHYQLDSYLVLCCSVIWIEKKIAKDSSIRSNFSNTITLLQEYLVSRHTETGRRQRQQAMELIEVNDKKYDEAEKMQTSLQRKK